MARDYHMTLQQMYKRDEAIWRVFTECGWSMQELADLHKITKGAVHKILKLCAKRKSEELEQFENYK